MEILQLQSKDRCLNCKDLERCQMYILSNMGIFEMEPIQAFTKCINLGLFKSVYEKEVWDQVGKWINENQDKILGDIDYERILRTEE